MTDSLEEINLFELDAEELERWKLVYEVSKAEHDASKAVAEKKEAEHSAELKRLEFERDAENRAKFVLSDNSRVYIFDDVVNGISVGACWDALQEWTGRTPGCDITIVLNSVGGSVLDGFFLFDELRALSNSGHHITTKIRGVAASMAGVLFQAGDTRLIGPESRLHLHEVSSGAIGKASAIKDEATLLANMNDQIAEIYSRRSHRSTDEIRTWFERYERWLTAGEAVDAGFADAIG